MEFKDDGHLETKNTKSSNSSVKFRIGPNHINNKKLQISDIDTYFQRLVVFLQNDDVSNAVDYAEKLFKVSTLVDIKFDLEICSMSFPSLVLKHIRLHSDYPVVESLLKLSINLTNADSNYSIAFFSAGAYGVLKRVLYNDETPPEIFQFSLWFLVNIASTSAQLRDEFMNTFSIVILGRQCRLKCPSEPNLHARLVLCCLQFPLMEEQIEKLASYVHYLSDMTNTEEGLLWYVTILSNLVDICNLDDYFEENKIKTLFEASLSTSHVKTIRILVKTLSVILKKQRIRILPDLDIVYRAYERLISVPASMIDDLVHNLIEFLDPAVTTLFQKQILDHSLAIWDSSSSATRFQLFDLVGRIVITNPSLVSDNATQIMSVSQDMLLTDDVVCLQVSLALLDIVFDYDTKQGRELHLIQAFIDNGGKDQLDFVSEIENADLSAACKAISSRIR